MPALFDFIQLARERFAAAVPSVLAVPTLNAALDSLPHLFDLPTVVRIVGKLIPAQSHEQLALSVFADVEDLVWGCAHDLGQRRPRPPLANFIELSAPRVSSVMVLGADPLLEVLQVEARPKVCAARRAIFVSVPFAL